MSEYQAALAIGALVTALISMNLPRARLWIVMGALSFVGGTAYFRLGMPHYPIANLALDAIVCLTLNAKAREVWELWLYRIFQFSVFVSLVFLCLKTFAPVIAVHWLYVLVLEGSNWAALFVIASTAAQDRVRADGGDIDRSRFNHLHRSQSHLRKARAEDPWHKIR